MQRIEFLDSRELATYCKVAARYAKQAKCHRAKCGTIIMKDGIMLGSGFNGPAAGLESNRTCDSSWDRSIKPKYDLTCCIHAEWRAILDACKRHGDNVEGSTLYFVRVDGSGQMLDSGNPYCTVCSRLALEAGIKDFALYQNGGANIYPTAEYDALSYHYFAPKTT